MPVSNTTCKFVVRILLIYYEYNIILLVLTKMLTILPQCFKFNWNTINNFLYLILKWKGRLSHSAANTCPNSETWTRGNFPFTLAAFLNILLGLRSALRISCKVQGFTQNTDSSACWQSAWKRTDHNQIPVSWSDASCWTSSATALKPPG